MKLEVGKYYRTRDGRKVGPMEAFESNNGMHPFEWGGLLWTRDGVGYKGEYPDQDIIAEWTDTPEVGTLAEIEAKVGDVVEWQWNKQQIIIRDWMIHSYDGKYRIISRASDTGPVRTVTRTTLEIVPGVYGKVHISTMGAGEGRVGISLDGGKSWGYFNSDDLSAAIATLAEVVEALESPTT